MKFLMQSVYFLLAVLLLTGGQSVATASDSSSLDTELTQLIQVLGLTGDPSHGLTIPDINSPKAQLGMQLFYSKTLGGEQDSACVTCHHPMLGGGDNLSLSVGVGSAQVNLLGPGRTLKEAGFVNVPRNAPTTFNVALWKKHMFHDGRVKRLDQYSIETPDTGFNKADALGGDNLVQAQARFPVTSVEEMRGNFMSDALTLTLRRSLTDRLKKNWERSFRNAFNDHSTPIDDLITEQNVSEALADYERSQLFIDNPWKAYVAGDQQAISDSAKRGASLFFKSQDQGGAGCASCHSGDFFTNEEFYNTGMPQIGEGKPLNENDTSHDDQGCFNISGKEDDRYRFRTPSLLNVEVTGPWGHNGAYTSLEAVTAHMLNPHKALRQYDPKQLQQTGIRQQSLERSRQGSLKAGIDIQPVANSSKQDIDDLVAFMKTLTDPCVKSRQCLSPWIPAANANDPDGNMLHGVGQDGQRL